MSRSGLLQRLFVSRPSTVTKKARPRLGVEALEAREVPSFGLPTYKSGLADVSAPEHVKAGDYVTVSVNNGWPSAISMSWADLDDVQLDGKPVPATGGVATLYDWGYDGIPQPDPDGGAMINLPTGAHTVRFHIEPDAPDQTIEINGTPGVSHGSWASGPFVVVGGSYYGHPWATAVPFEIDGNTRNPLKLAVTGHAPHGNKAEAEDIVTYRVTSSTTRKDMTSYTVTTTIPAGSTLVPNSFTGRVPTVNGNQLVWKLTGTDAKKRSIASTFKVQVAKEDQLGTLRALKLAAVAETVSKAKGTETRNIEQEMKLVRATQVTGVVKDLKLAFPQTNSVTTPALANVEVRLLKKGTNAVLDTATTDGAGKFEVQAPRPGKYILEVTSKVDRYQLRTKEIKAGDDEVVQRIEVNIDDKRTEPFKADDVFLPVQVLNRTAQLMKTLHDVRPQILGGIVNAVVEPFIPDFMRFGYDLDSVNNLVDKVLSSGKNEQFVGVYDGTGKKDIVNGLIRVNAFMETLALRLDATLKHADTFAKALALMVSTNLIPALAATRPQKKLTQVEQVAKFTALNAKIITMSTVIPWTLKTLFSTFNLSQAARDKISTIVFNVARYAFDKYTGQTMDDLLFETIFTGIRTGATAGYLQANINGLFGVRGSQNTLDETAAMAARKVYSEGTNATLAYMETLWGKIDDRAKFVETVSANAQTVLNYARLITGLRDVYTGGSAATGSPVKPGDVGIIGKMLDSMNSKLWPVTDLANATKAQFFQNAFKATMVYMLPLYVLPIGLPVLELYTVDPLVEAIGKGSMSGPIATQIDPPPSANFQPLFDALAKFVLNAATSSLVL
jgi:Prealbumin-like fold domain